MIKLVASDLDGTLLLHKAQSLPEEIFSLIRQLEELGIMFVAASGRQYPNMTKLFAPVASEISYISENGALAVDHGEVLYQDSFRSRKPHSAPTVYIPAALPVFISVLVSPTYMHSSGFTPNFSATISGPSGAGFLRIASL